MTYPVYAQKARLPQRRPRFLFHRPARSIIRVTLPCPPAAVYGQGPSRNAETPRDTKEIPRVQDIEAPKLRTIKAPSPHAATPSLPSDTTGRRSTPSYYQPTPHTPVTTGRCPTLRPQPAGSSHPVQNRQSTERKRPASTPRARTPAPCPATKKTGSCPCWGSFPIILLQARAYFCTVPDAASRRLL